MGKKSKIIKRIKRNHKDFYEILYDGRIRIYPVSSRTLEPLKEWWYYGRHSYKALVRKVLKQIKDGPVELKHKTK